ncbi:calcium/sodium antiporter [Roseimaritima sediminicola]|uniref:calcium/sodium antiporter n=1 Tax=Roseimaritima sediminicola TaxID=2662066 RepID=UPI001EED0845|nr:calcium/sodium antiporter [Roseimaritima sediminicola]
MLLLGLAVLTGGAELLVRGASKLAAALGISPLVVGLTVVAYGTSTPELVVSIQSALSGQGSVALGNAVGSNIFNVLFILGTSALIVSLRVLPQLIRFDVPLMIVLSFAVLLLSIDGRLGRVDGVLFTAGLLAYTVWSIVAGRKEQAAAGIADVSKQESMTAKPGPKSIAIDGLLVVVGLGLLVLGSRWFVTNAVALASSLGVSEMVIGLTIVAAGTSLPEVATSVTAAIRGERDMAVGNVIGSNLFNILGVLGISSLVAADGVPVSESAFWIDLPVMIAVAVACLPIFFTGHLIARWEGGLFLAYYFGYTGYLVGTAMSADWARSWGLVMLGLVVPLTVITLAIGLVRNRSSRAQGVP